MLADIWDIGFTKKKTYESYWVYFNPEPVPERDYQSQIPIETFFFLPKSKPIICCIQVNLLMAQKS